SFTCAASVEPAPADRNSLVRSLMFASQSRRDVHTVCAHFFGGTFCAGAGAVDGACGSIAHAAWAGTTSKAATPNPRTPAQNRMMRPHVRLLVQPPKT